MFWHFLAKTLQALELKAFTVKTYSSFPENQAINEALEQTTQNPGKRGKQAFQAVFSPFNINFNL